MTHHSRNPRLLWHLVEASLSEADFLWTRLDDSLDAHDRTLAHVESWVESRLLGALDGVRIGGERAVEPLLATALHDRDPGLVSVAAHVLLRLAHPAADRVLEASLRKVSCDRVDAFSRGLGRTGQVPALHNLWVRVQDASADARAAVLEALAFCGAAPDANWRALLGDDSPRLRAAAASALRFVPSVALDSYVQLACDTRDPHVRNRAIVAGLAAGSGSCWRRCIEHVRKPDADTGPLLLPAAALGSEHELARVLEARHVPALCRDALWALGFAGTPAAIEACLEQMRTGHHVRVAAEALCASTGLDPSHTQLQAAAREPAEDDMDADLVLTGDDLLPLPDVPAVEQWWDRQRSHFVDEQRYLGGKISTAHRLHAALEAGPTRRRPALALELSARSAGAFRLQTLDFCIHQRQQLSSFAALAPNSLRDAASALGIRPLSEA
jgi:uncharacterized protein (TIGR02270 family)